MAYKRILTVQDISCLGQCSMTVALPILSACGHETCILPTALLSTHTGGFGKPAVTCLDAALPGIIAHWQHCGITFDAVLVGYLGSIAAIDAAMTVLDTLLAPDGIAIVDPAMADRGKLYAGLDTQYVQAMKKLCRRADVILPNMTEAAMLSDADYQEGLDENALLRLLEALGHPNVILTGAELQPGETGVAVYSGGQLRHYAHRKIGGGCHGTGDMFAAAFTGALLQGKDQFRAVQIAADFTCRCIENTMENPAHWYGVKFEPVLPELTESLW